jgi:hypothetical protein
MLRQLLRRRFAFVTPLLLAACAGGSALPGTGLTPCASARQVMDTRQALVLGYAVPICPPAPAGGETCFSWRVTDAGRIALGYGPPGTIPDARAERQTLALRQPLSTCVASPTPAPASSVPPTASPSPTPIPTAIPTPTPTLRPTPSSSASAGSTPSPTASPKPTPTPTPIPTAKPSPVVTASPTPSATSEPIVSPPAGGYGPASLQAAYNIDPSAGAGRTVALVESGGYSKAESDLQVYRNLFGLPLCTSANGCFKVVNQTGQTTGLPPDSNVADPGEDMLDLEMVSAMCPNCNILMVETKTFTSPDLATAVDTAVALGAAAVSNSYSASEESTDAAQVAPHYNHPGVFITASSGDSGYSAEAGQPATFATVIAVGGTTLVRDPSTPRGWKETVWNMSGSGCSKYIPKPAWQTDPGCSGKRTVADVAFDADWTNSGVAVYTSTEGGWGVDGGTSAAAPAVAAIYTLVGNGVGDASYIYSHASALYNITSGTNGTCSVTYLCTAGPGYSGPVGWGTPNGTGAF